MMFLKSSGSFLSFVFLAALTFGGPVLQAQGHSETAPANNPEHTSATSERETDLGFNFYRALNSATTANGVVQTPEDAIGGMLEVRHIHSPLIGYELTYSHHPAGETIAPTAPPSCGYSCNSPAETFSSSGDTVGLDWVVSKSYGRLRPFAAGGMGFFIDSPGYSLNPNNDVVRIAYLYGGGVDFSISEHFGLRAQYRGVVYRAPNIATMFPAQGVFTQTKEPMGGFFYRF